MKARITQLLVTLKTQLAADKKKSGVLVVLLIVLLTALGRVMIHSSGPSPAEARTVTPNADPGANTPDRIAGPAVERPSVVERSVTIQPGPVSTAKAVTSTGVDATVREEVAVHVRSLPRTLLRDLFSTPAWSSFPPAIGSLTPTTQSTERRVAHAGFWTRVVGRLSEEQKERAEAINKLEGELQQLRLEGTLIGNEPLAHISGRLVRRGDSIHGFTVEQIRDRSVTLRKSGFSRTLTMP